MPRVRVTAEVGYEDLRWKDILRLLEDFFEECDGSSKSEEDYEMLLAVRETLGAEQFYNCIGKIISHDFGCKDTPAVPQFIYPEPAIDKYPGY